MGEEQSNRVLQRKASAGRRQHEAHGMPPSKALRLALSRSAEKLWGLPLTVQGVRQELLDQAGALDSLEDGMLFLLLDGPDGAVGALAMDQQALAALIESQTMGRVVPRPAADRVPTGTDAAVVAPLVDAILGRLAVNLAGDADGWWAAGYRFGDMVEDRRALGLVLEAREFHAFRLTADFDGGAKQGEIALLLPHGERPVSEAAPQPIPGGFAEQLVHVPAEVVAVIDRLRMPLSRAGQLQPGDLLTLMPNAIGQVRLMSGNLELAQVELGQKNGMRAVRLVSRGAAAGAPERPGQEAVAEAAAPSSVPAATAMPAPAAAPEEVMTGQDGLSGFDGLEDLPELPPLDFDDSGFAQDVPPLPDGSETDVSDTVDAADMPNDPRTRLDVAASG